MTAPRGLSWPGHALLRPSAPRHPPSALSSLTERHSTPAKSKSSCPVVKVPIPRGDRGARTPKPPPCKGGALPVELCPQVLTRGLRPPLRTHSPPRPEDYSSPSASGAFVPQERRKSFASSRYGSGLVALGTGLPRGYGAHNASLQVSVDSVSSVVKPVSCLRPVGLSGLEPETSVLSGPRSNHLS